MKSLLTVAAIAFTLTIGATAFSNPAPAPTPESWNADTAPIEFGTCENTAKRQHKQCLKSKGKRFKDHCDRVRDKMLKKCK